MKNKIKEVLEREGFTKFNEAYDNGEETIHAYNEKTGNMVSVTLNDMPDEEILEMLFDLN